MSNILFLLSFILVAFRFRSCHSITTIKERADECSLVAFMDVCYQDPWKGQMSCTQKISVVWIVFIFPDVLFPSAYAFINVLSKFFKVGKWNLKEAVVIKGMGIVPYL